MIWSGAITLALAPASILILQRVILPSIERELIHSPEYSISSKLKKIKFEDWNAERKFYLCYRKKSGPGLAMLAEEILRSAEKWRSEKEAFNQA